MNSLSERLHDVWHDLPEGVRLVAVSKFHPAEQVMEAYEAGQRIFGENHAQELAAKAAMLPDDIEWHFIGHLQTNKVRMIASYVSLVHSVDSLRLLREINKQAQKNERILRCLLQLHVAQEETKFGFTPEEMLQMLAEGEWKSLENIRLCGIMCMATNTDDTAQIHREFKLAHETFLKAKERFFADDDMFCEQSMGMSDDYPIAISEGATLVRIGTRIFGPRNY